MMTMSSIRERGFNETERRFLHLAPSAVLFSRARPVARFDKILRDLVSEMYRVMYAERGVGLAAPQVGESLRVAVIDLQGRSLRDAGEKQENEDEDETTKAAVTKVAEGDKRGKETNEDGYQEVHEAFALVNPEIIWQSEDRRIYEEGCLSFPDLLVDVERPRLVEVRYQDIYGKECFVKACGLFSVCLQHEIDHLEGRTIMDSLSRLKRSMMLRKFAKLAKQASFESEGS